MKRILVFSVFAFFLVFLLSRLTNNSPWPSDSASSSTLFSSYSSPLKSLDAATSYYVHESAILDNIVEAPLDYDYVARPYRLVSRLLESLPEPRYYDESGALLGSDPEPGLVSRVEYLLRLRSGLRYQEHPCFVRDADGSAYYAQATRLPKKAVSLLDFPRQGSRELRAEDFRLALIRLCDPRLSSPVYSNLSSFISGMRECSEQMRERLSAADVDFLDYRGLDFAGIEVLGAREFKLCLSRKYPQALYWLAMHFFAPLPWEALEFYALPQVRAAGFSLQNWPVGSGPYKMSRMQPNLQVLLERNQNYEGRSPEERQAPGSIIERIVFQYEREAIPGWIKFNQGYYDHSGLPSDFLQNATDFSGGGELQLSKELLAKGLEMHQSITPTIFYFGFNMLDETVGGSGESERLLRLALSIVLDYQEFIDIFLNGQGLPAQCVIPPSISGSCRDNPFVSPWDEKLGRSRRRSLDEARELMRQAGYENGLDREGKALRLYLDHANAGSSNFKAQFQWLKNKFASLGIQLEERASDLNRWRDKLQNGNWQLIFNKGWLADYPDPENFLFLFYSKNGTVQSQGRGANYVNYASPEFDRLFEQLECMLEGPRRQELIAQACELLQKDAPCCWGFHPAKVLLTHGWLKNYQPHDMSYGTMKHLRLDGKQRQKMQSSWNKPRMKIVYAAMLLFTLAGVAIHTGKNFLARRGQAEIVP